MRTTILFGGPSRERLVAVASAQSLTRQLPDADLWFWAPDGQVYPASQAVLLGHDRPFELDLPTEGAPIGDIETALDVAAREDRALLLSLHGGFAEDGGLQKLCEARGVAFTGSGSHASWLAFSKTRAKDVVAQAGVSVPQNIAAEDAQAALAKYGRLIAKPSEDGSSYGLIFVDTPADLDAALKAATEQAYVIEPFVQGLESTCGVLELASGELIALPPVEIRPSAGKFDYTSKYLAKDTEEICPATFAPEISAALQDQALKAHEALGCRGYSRSDFIVSEHGLVYLETNTLPGLTASSLYPKALKAQGIEVADFLRGQLALAEARAKQAAAVA
ncbi:D-alanine--D-alanine ligase [Caulobacter sp. D4A]|uniref:D-alanine--D-alanine ligase family protein n=1 Tax=unclassified Caulobacter TaxID=2648921 RepID=UPI000D729552|nr:MULTISPECIES: D-alanine--D-alanine ligase [unclassified Caulobacter]PXA82632.1 D-alanine--D-alanine ligase [Caulobacter sp. D4A]PXA93308.1 D-alanine--D-alanine ligase [Caulobacter sp. D5]